MFTLSGLFSKNESLEDQNEYTKVSSLIEHGSVLDRRKPRTDRRSYNDRRMRLREAFTGLDKRCDVNRRSTENRRTIGLEEESNSLDIGKAKESLNDVNKLVSAQVDVIRQLKLLSVSAKKNEFQNMEENIRNISFNIKNIKCEEEKLLYLSFDKNLSEKNSESLTEILCYIHDISDQVLEYLDRYCYAGVTDKNVRFFLLDMNIVSESLVKILEKKREILYPVYERI